MFMAQNVPNDREPVKDEPAEGAESSKELQLGSRKVSKQNHSRIVTLPRVFLDNSCKSQNMHVSMSLLADGSLKLTPDCEAKEPKKEVKEND
jgi:hypothetical protein